MQIRKRIPYARCWHGWESSDARCVGGPRDSSVTMFVDLLAWISQHSLSKEKRHVSGSQANALWTEPAFDLLLFLCPEKSILNRSTYGIFTAIASSLNTIQMYHSRNISLSLSLSFSYPTFRSPLSTFAMPLFFFLSTEKTMRRRVVVGHYPLFKYKPKHRSGQLPVQESRPFVEHSSDLKLHLSETFTGFPGWIFSRVNFSKNLQKCHPISAKKRRRWKASEITWLQNSSSLKRGVEREESLKESWNWRSRTTLPEIAPVFFPPKEMSRTRAKEGKISRRRKFY